ncbi:pilus assembly protein [Derxia gummosa]|uniref:Pilus assembly protein n=1 Tax=Derxia gummosa DSM 723 TaxID=1121388 RepID=A0A8B6X3T0_9BURK|nr:PilC/PilY family type IV pilus protein [Derxia gummosa]
MNTTLRSLALVACLAAPLLAHGQGASIAQTPLTAVIQPPANLALALSVEYPTAGYAYNGVAYSRTKEFAGNFNSRICYSYDSSKQYFVAATNTTSSTSNSFACANTYWSGNFLNWATTSSLDLFRMVLSGGWRVLDQTYAEGGKTVISRAFLPDVASNSVPSFYASGNFPRLSISSTNASGSVPTTVLGTLGTLYVVNCRDKMFVGSASNSTGTCANPGTDGDRFAGYARVSICDSLEVSTGRSSLYSGSLKLCTRYGSSGSYVYKPEGVMQFNRNDVNYAAFGYLMESSQSRYGGVLRAPMRHITDEYSETTGVQLINPLNDTLGVSGVLNYLNRFGLSQPSLQPYASDGTVNATWDTNQSHSYKVYDQFSELWYQAFQYLRGKPADALATQNMTTAMKSGFPVYSAWKGSGLSGALPDPVTSSCQNNFIFTIADTNTWCDRYLPGNTTTNSSCGDSPRSVASGEIDAYAATVTLGNSIAQLSAQRAAGALANRSTLATDLTGVGNAGYLASGLAYWGATHAFRSDLGSTRPLVTYAFDVMESSGIAVENRQLYLMGLGGGAKLVDGVYRSPYQSNGMPNNYFQSKDPFVMFASMQSAFAQVVAAQTSGSTPAVSAARTYAGSLAFQPMADTGGWQGTLRAFAQQAFGSYTAGQQVWNAATQITSDSGRKIITWSPTLSRGVPFQWSNLATAQQTALNTDENGTADTKGSQRLSWLRGSASNEGTTSGYFRQRTNTNTLYGNTKLGDIINSSPAYAGVPSASIADASYGSFRSTYASRTPVVWVGANDGMLHGFNANTGAEVLAYVPASVYSNLSKLPSLTYSHRYFVDGSPIVGDANISSTTTANWATVLVGTLGAGGNGVFALNVTNPTNFSEANASSIALWEFSSSDDADLGAIIGTPTHATATGVPEQITRLKVNGRTRWAVLLGNGYGSTAGKPVLYALFLDKTGSGWTAGTDYVKLVAADTGTEATGNGLSMPVPVDFDNDGITDVIYAGDLRGNLWRFNVSVGSGDGTVTDAPSTWNVANSGAPLFTAYAADGTTRQPITGAPVAVPNPATGDGWLVVFGTGKLFETGDQASTGQQALYGIWDADGATAVSMSQLKSLALSSTTYTSATNSGTVRGFTTATGAFCFSTTQSYGGASCNASSTLFKGWRVSLPASGERVTSNAENVGRYAVITSFIPPAADCSTAGNTWLNVIDIVFGGLYAPPFTSTSGVEMPSQSLGSSNFTVGMALQSTTLPATGACSGSSCGTTCGLGVNVVTGGTNGVQTSAQLEACGNLGRLSWREFGRP